MKKSFDGSSIGTSLILVVFITICLLTFATLSLVSAQSDNELSLSAAEKVMEFYDSEAMAQETLKKIDDELLSIYQESVDKESYYATVLKNFSDISGLHITNDEVIALTYMTRISDAEVITSQIQIIYPDELNHNLYKIQSWKLINTIKWEEDTKIEIWNGEF